MDDRNPQFRGMLVSINNRLKSSELKILIYYAEIKRKLAETIEQPIDLFQILEERLDLKPNDLRYFRKMIASLETRKDLLKIIDDYVRDNKMCPGGPPQQHYSESPPMHVYRSGRKILRQILKRLEIGPRRVCYVVKKKE